MYFRCFIFVVSFSISTSVYSQAELFHLDNAENELKIVERLVLNKVDSLRARKKLPTLQNSKTIRKAAELQAVWISGKGKLTHIQTKSKTKTPQKRVAYVGGKNELVGENIAYTQYNTVMINSKGKEYSNTTYEAIANDLVAMWRHSKGHYQNIITKGYKITGVALALDIEHKKVYAVQVFAGEQ